MIASCIWIFFILPYAWGNTEKAIFLGPSLGDIVPAYPALDDLQLTSLSPDQFTIRTHLKAAFPSNEFKHGYASWFALYNLTEGQRYEVRVCWAATQPTAFKLETYEPETVSRTPELASELSAYASTLQYNMHKYVAMPPQTQRPGMEDPALLLRVLAAADFYTTNHTLMKRVPPVFVDIILDPFVLNILPRSLLPTIAYAIAVAIISCQYLNARIFATGPAVASADRSLNKDSVTSFQEDILPDFHDVAEQIHDWYMKLGQGIDVVQLRMEGVDIVGCTLKKGDTVVGGSHKTAGMEKMCIGFVEELLTFRRLAGWRWV
ncbi:hypothetical protein NUW58_g4091 [Xylaria curta]|uniref:Uncharacterized protein n=1 Tax=Xylaria curta TaxID=42375 RepID=A0ACC1P7X8_9PEZI|nr:hypothetical protein NUW58_g4091 [Xylaria curta]